MMIFNECFIKKYLRGFIWTVYNKAFRFSRGNKKNFRNITSEIELTFNVDDELKKLEIDYVLLKKDTVWNMLNVLATFARANIFTGRDGSIRVTPSEKYTEIAAVGVTPDNSFSFNLPDFSKTVVNRVKAEYTELAVGEEKDDQFEVDLSKCEKDDDNNYIVELNLTNFHGVISKEMIKRYATIDYDKTTDNELSFFADFLVGDR